MDDGSDYKGLVPTHEIYEFTTEDLAPMSGQISTETLTGYHTQLVKNAYAAGLAKTALIPSATGVQLHLQFDSDKRPDPVPVPH